MNPKIYEFVKSDFLEDQYKDQLVKIMQESEQFNYPNTIVNSSFGLNEYEKLKEYFLSEMAKVIVLLDNNIVASYVWFFIKGNRIHINEIATKKEYRGNGFAKVLLNYIELSSTSDESIDAIELFVLENNSSAINLYSELGFVTEKRLLLKPIKAL